MKNDREKLKKMLAELPKENSYFRRNVLNNLFNAINEETGNLDLSLYIPMKEIDDFFLRDILEIELGYKAEYDDSDYNPYHECFCYKIKLSR